MKVSLVRRDNYDDAYAIRVMPADQAKVEADFFASAEKDAKRLCELFSNGKCVGFLAWDDDKAQAGDDKNGDKTENIETSDDKSTNIVVGYSFAYGYVSAVFGGLILFMADIYVKNGWRSRGVGKLLMDEVQRFAKRNGFRTIRWSCRHNNPRAMKFYREFVGARDLSSGDVASCALRRWVIPAENFGMLLKSTDAQKDSQTSLDDYTTELIGVKSDFENGDEMVENIYATIKEFLKTSHQNKDFKELFAVRNEKLRDLSLETLRECIYEGKCDLFLLLDITATSNHHTAGDDSPATSAVIGWFLTTIGYNGFADWLLDTLVVDFLWVEPKYRNKGFGRLLLAHLAKEAESKNCRAIHWFWPDLPPVAPNFGFNEGLAAACVQPFRNWSEFELDGA